MRDVIGFVLVTYTASWLFFAAAGWWTHAEGASPGSAAVRSVLFMMGTVAPTGVALAWTARGRGREAVTALLRRLVQWHPDWRWWLFAAGYMATIKLLVAVAHRIIAGAWPTFGTEPWYVIVGAMLLSTVVGGQAGEELGWRGFALPRLQSRLGMARASLLLGVVWAVWHLPFFFIPGVDKYGQSFPFYALQVIALSVAMACLYAHTNGSLLLAMFMHSAVNQTKGIVSSALPDPGNVFALRAPLPGWLTLGFLWLGAIICLRLLPKDGRRDG